MAAMVAFNTSTLAQIAPLGEPAVAGW